MRSQSPSDMLSQSQKVKGKKMVKDIYTWWKTVSKVGKLIHGDEEYYSVNPKHWRYSPDYLLSNNDKYDFKMLQDNWKDSKEEYNHAKRALKKYEKQKKSTVRKPRCPNGTRRNKKTGKCEK
jgi:hypothetical protein